MGGGTDGRRPRRPPPSEGMDRLLILCPAHPHRASRDETRAWLRERAGELGGAADVAAARLVELACPSDDRPCEWQWLIELHLADGARDVVDRPPVADVLLDMRLLGMPADVAYAPDAG